MKRVICLLISLVVMISVLPSNVFAEPPLSDSRLDNTAVLTGYTENCTNKSPEDYFLANLEQNKKALIIGGTSGIGLATAAQLKEQGYSVIIVGRHKPDETLLKLNKQDKFIQFNLNDEDLSFLDGIDDINVLIFAAGAGRIASFSDISDAEIKNDFRVNTTAAMRIIKKYYNKINSSNDFYTAVISSFAGEVSSPLFALYSATKSALCKFIESVNVELEMQGSINKILNITPGYIDGTNFYGQGVTDMDKLCSVAKDIVNNMFEKKENLTPQKQELYEKLIKDYQLNPREFGVNAYKYKMRSNRNSEKPKLKVGFLIGTFDLFHIGHLNILRNAKKYCDYLVVGVHKDGSHKNKSTFIPLSERMDIVKNIKYVDKCIALETPEEIDLYDKIKYDLLFVGDDYKDSEKFKRYEEYFADKNVEIIYLPYTKTTSSTHLRKVIEDVA